MVSVSGEKAGGAISDGWDDRHVRLMRCYNVMSKLELELKQDGHQDRQDAHHPSRAAATTQFMGQETQAFCEKLRFA